MSVILCRGYSTKQLTRRPFISAMDSNSPVNMTSCEANLVLDHHRCCQWSEHATPLDELERFASRRGFRAAVSAVVFPGKSGGTRVGCTWELRSHQALSRQSSYSSPRHRRPDADHWMSQRSAGAGVRPLHRGGPRGQRARSRAVPASLTR